MNEKIRALAEQAGFYGSEPFADELERFARLIIYECEAEITLGEPIQPGDLWRKFGVIE